jgi:uncharacterized phage-associated protein
MAPFIDVFSPEKTADFLLIDCRDRGDVLTNLKLQKLLYYAQAWYLALHQKPLFDEDFEAWVHGPVLPSQYRRFKEFEWKPILREIPPLKPDDPVILSHLTEIVDVFGSETAVALEMMTHNELPWKSARSGIPLDQPSSSVISKESMQSYYKSL